MRHVPWLRPLALAAALAAAGAASAQTFSLNWNPRSGDVWVDTQLADINRYGMAYRDPFIDEMVRYHGAPRDLVTDLLVDRRWAPGDVYYACALAQAVGRPCRAVVDEWERSHGQGWGVVAQRMGIRPGSPAFHRLKKGFVPTYDRWHRPIRLDDDLRRAYPDRGRGEGHAHGKPATPKAAPGGKGHGAPAGKGRPAARGGKGPGASHGKGHGKH